MAKIVGHLNIEELGERYRASTDACTARHFQAIWLLAQGQTLAHVASITGLTTRWLERLARRYNEQGPEALGDRRCGNGAERRILTPELLDKLRVRLTEPPPDRGVWTTPKIAIWMAQELGLVSVFPQRAWDALQAIGWTIQVPRPRHPQSAGPEEVATSIVLSIFRPSWMTAVNLFKLIKIQPRPSRTSIGGRAFPIRPNQPEFVLGVELANRESRSSWKDFLLGLRNRGLSGVEFVVSDDHAGLKAAIREVLPEAVWQRCYVHFLRNALDYVPRKSLSPPSR